MVPNELRQYGNRKLFIALGAMIAITFFTTIATVFTISTLLVYRQGAQKHNDNRLQLEQLQTSLSDAESGQRGYIMTTDAKYLKSYDKAVKIIPKYMASIDNGTVGAELRKDFMQLSSDVDDKLKELAETVALGQAGNYPAAQEIILSGTGLTLMDNIRNVSEKIQDFETAQLVTDRNSITNLATLARDISFVNLLAVLGLSILVYWTYLTAIASERRLDQAKDEFVSLASHQLRTPATGIKSILSTLAAGDFGALNERQQYFMQRALQSNERELNIIEELLNVAKADAGRLVLHSTEFDLCELVSTITSEQAGAIKEKNQELVVRVPHKPVMMLADEEKLYMAIGNLLDNARKYTPEAGKIQVSVSTGHHQTRIEVADSGIGIEPDDVKHIFDRYHRAGDALRGHTEGAGLGLYLAGRIAELHNGTIEVSSKLGKGTKFAMILPQGERNAAESSAS